MKENIKKSRFHSKNFFVFVFISVVAVCLAASYNEHEVQAAPNSTVYLEPASVSAATGGTFNLNAIINPGTNEVSAVELHVAFDRTKVRLDSVTPNTAAGAFPDVLQAAQIDNNAGTAVVILGSGSSGYVTTIKTIATFAFTAIGSGTSAVELTGTMAAAKNESSDVITTRTPAQITINAETYGIVDFQHIVSNWLQTNQAFAKSDGDINADKTVNSRDLGIVMSFWAN